MVSIEDIDEISYLAWQDVVERLNILIYEIRHLQQNIIYSLRTPYLYRVLRYEEKYLWPIEKEDSSGTSTRSKYVKRYSDIVIPFPTPFQSGKQDQIKEDEGHGDLSKFKTDLTGFVRFQWNSGRWSREQQEYYLVLCATQILKRQIIKDKAILLFEGTSVLLFMERHRLSDEIKKIDASVCRLMLLRSGIVAKISDYICRLGDFQKHFSKSQDHALQDHPRPSLQRRREQRFYASFLSRRTPQLFHELTWLLRANKDFSGVSDEANTQQSIVLHRWQHHYTSQSFTISDVHIINTSYFMPERPDFQLLIDHEAAHAILRERYNNFYFQDLEHKGEFRELIRAFIGCLTRFEFQSRTGLDEMILAKEIGADILAATIRGAAYLYALFLEIFGSDLDNVFRFGGTAEVDLDFLDTLNGTCGLYDKNRSWFLRLHVVCTWIEQVYSFKKNLHNKSAHTLETKLISSVRYMLDSMTTYLDQLAPDSLKSAKYWFALRKRFDDLIIDFPASKSVRRSIKELHEAFYHQPAPTEITTETQDESKVFYTKPLNGYDRTFLNCLFKHTAQFKHEFHDPLCSLGLGMSDTTHERIIDSPDELAKLSKLNYVPGSIFEFHHDIAWQYAMMMCQLLFKDIRKPKSTQPHAFITKINEFNTSLTQFMNPIRQAHQFALDLFLHNTEPPSILLEEICRLVLEPTSWEFNKDGPVRLLRSLAEYEKVVSWYFYTKFDPKKQIFERKEDQWILKPLYKKEQDQNDRNDNDKDKQIILEYTMGEEILKEIEKVIRNLSKESFITKYTYIEGFANTYGALPLLRVGSRFPAISQEKFILYCIQLEKLQNFFDIMGVCSSHALVLKNHLKLYRSKGKVHWSCNPDKQSRELLNDYYINLFTAFIKKPDSGGSNPGTSETKYSIPAPYLFAKVSTASVSKITSKELKHIIDEPFRPRRAEEGIFYSYAKLLGRYDFMLCAIADSKNSYKMPSFHDFPNPPNSNNFKFQEEKFLPFFLRWEMALPFKISNNTWTDPKKSWKPSNTSETSSEKVHPPIAFISLALAHGVSRIDFLYRVARPSWLQPSQPRCVEISCPDCKRFKFSNYTMCFYEDDYALLTDGWEDILFVLHGPPKHIHRAFQIQKGLYHDFQVQRTEMILAYSALKEVNESPECFDLRRIIRISDQSTLSDVYKDLETKFNKADPVVSRIPGRMDYMVHTPAQDNESINAMSSEDSLFKNVHIDRIQTDVGYRISKRCSESTTPSSSSDSKETPAP